MNTGVGFDLNGEIKEVNYNDLLERLKKGSILVSLDGVDDLIIVIKNENEYMFMEETAGGNLITEDPYEDMFKEMIENNKSFVTIDVRFMYDGEGKLFDKIEFIEGSDVVFVIVDGMKSIIKYRGKERTPLNPDEYLSKYKLLTQIKY